MANLEIRVDVPPPYTSGVLHIGHAYQYVPIDVLKRFCKYKKIPYIDNFGFDVHGLPSELKLKQIEPNITLQKLEKFTNENISSMLESFKKLKIQINNPWNTNQEFYIEKVHLLLECAYKKKLLEMKNRVNYYCINCKTNLSKSEISIVKCEKKGYFIKFTVDNQVYEFLTTKPEMLFNAIAIFVNPNDKRYVNLIGKIAFINYRNLKLPILADELVKIDFGSGIIIVAAYGNIADADYLNRHNLPAKNYIDLNGICEGLPFNEFIKKELKLIEEANIISKIELVKANNYIHSERSSCKNEIHYIATPQIYLKSSLLKNEIINVINKIEFRPDKYKNELLNWCKNLDDWCISRQNLFGTNFNFYVNYNTYEISLEKKENFIKPIDVCDCWLDSSITWTLNNSNIRFQGYEICRTWLLYSIISCVILGNDKPFDVVRFTSLVLGENNKKISKSNNYDYTINTLVKKYSSNIIRLWSAKTFTNSDSVFNEVNIKRTEAQLKKLKSIFNFYKLNLNNITPNVNIELDTDLLNIYNNIKTEFDLAILNLNFSIYEKILCKFIIQKLSREIIPTIIKNKYPSNVMKTYKIILSWLYEIFELIIPDELEQLF